MGDIFKNVRFLCLTAFSELCCLKATFFLTNMHRKNPKKYERVKRCQEKCFFGGIGLNSIREFLFVVQVAGRCKVCSSGVKC